MGAANSKHDGPKSSRVMLRWLPMNLAHARPRTDGGTPPHASSRIFLIPFLLRQSPALPPPLLPPGTSSRSHLASAPQHQRL
jgi:hypothetical protein